MSLATLRKLISRQDPFPSIRLLLEESARLISVEEIASEVKPVFTACVAAEQREPVAVIAYSQEEAERLWEGLLAYGLPEESVVLVPAAEGLLFEDGPPDWRVIGARIRALSRLALHKPTVLVMPVSAALARTLPRLEFAGSFRDYETGQTLDLAATGLELVSLGYQHADVVTERGEFCVRGGLLDVWPPTEGNPVRIELFGDEIESIRFFDTETQRSTEQTQKVLIPPAREVLPGKNGERAAGILEKHLAEQVDALEAQGRHPDADALEARVSEHLTALRQGMTFNGVEFYLPYLTTEEVCLLDWLPSSALVIWDEPNLSKSNWDQRREEVFEVSRNRALRGQALALDREHHVSFDKGREKMLARKAVIVSSLPHHSTWLHTPHRITLGSAGMDTFGSQVGVFTQNARNWIEHGCSVVVVTQQVLRMGQMLLEKDVRPVRGELRSEFEPGVYVIEGALPGGYRLPDMKLMVVAESDVFGTAPAHRPRPTRRESQPIQSVLELKEGDYIVHVHHGIGLYRGLTTITNENGTKDYLLLEYAGGDKLYVPADQTDRVQKYSGAEAGPPCVHRLGGSDWAKTKKKVKAAVKEMAKELLQMYAAREALGGYGFPPDTPWQAEMEQAFPYQETEDQVKAIADVKRDLEYPKPMDRLVCGDVGFGKTEVAIRAAFKVVLEGKQVAILAPTTVLAQQHYNVFSERLAAFPLRVEMLSRFRSARAQKDILEDLKTGGIEVIIGTHRLLSKDVVFKDLGLVIVDEEQRFGVAHKERLKQLRVSVDVLTLTATPIPRTLHMSLAGLRDMSVINQAPEGRAPVRTYVREYDDDLVREAIVRELDRDGQVYILHNRVESIDNVADRISRLVPSARIVVGHGQMGEHELEDVMMGFYHQKYDVLVCTTIIESGIDVPNANTIIINHADKLGLAQLYQLRGRVGRSQRQAYAYLLYKSERILTEVAEKRLSAIREFADLGSGFKIAMRDMEIRGAGNILGPEQHGQMLSVGFDMYCHLLAQAVKELKGEEAPEEKTLPPVDLPVEAYIPEDYIPGEAQRIAIYRKLASRFTEEEVSKLEEELDDRFGPPPTAVRNALTILRLRIQAERLGIASISEEQGRLAVTLRSGCVIDPVALRQFQKAFRQHWWEPARVRLALEGVDPFELVSEFFRLIGRSIARPQPPPKRPGEAARERSMAR